MANTYYKVFDSATNTFNDFDEMYLSEAYLLDRYSGGQLFFAGYNNSGQAGNGSSGNSYSSPIQVGSFNNWSSISGGSFNSNANFAVTKDDGTLWGWGLNSNGQLGNGTTINYSSPIQIGALTSWLSVFTGSFATFAIKGDGTLWAWGLNSNGELGLNNINSYSSPVQIGALTDWSSVSIRTRGASAIKNNGTLWVWGANDVAPSPTGAVFGLGITSSTVKYSSPVQVGALTNWKQVACVDSSDTQIALKIDGTIWSWGNSSSGALGLGNTISYSSPVQIGTGTNWKSVQLGTLLGQSSPDTTYAIALKYDGSLWSWGYNGTGQLGNGSTINYSSPIQVGALSTWNKVFAKERSIYAIKNDGSLWAWGYNAFGQLANGSTINYSSPIQIGSLYNWRSVATDSYSTIFTAYRDITSN